MVRRGERLDPNVLAGIVNMVHTAIDGATPPRSLAQENRKWQKWKQFNAGIVLSKAEVDEFVSQGVTIQPMQWVETDKNAHKRRSDNKVPPLLKSRLVGCGNFEDTDGIRTDSPTGDVDSHNLVFPGVRARR